MDTFQICSRVARQEFSPRSNPCSMTWISKMQGNENQFLGQLLWSQRKTKRDTNSCIWFLLVLLCTEPFRSCLGKAKQLLLVMTEEALHKRWKMESQWSSPQPAPVVHLAPDNFIYIIELNLLTSAT